MHSVMGRNRMVATAIGTIHRRRAEWVCRMVWVGRRPVLALNGGTISAWIRIVRSMMVACAVIRMHGTVCSTGGCMAWGIFLDYHM